MNRPLIAIKAERRMVALAVFRDHIFRYAEALSLASDPGLAWASAQEFLFRTARRFDIQLAVAEDAHATDEARSAELLSHLEEALRKAGIPTSRIPKQAIFEAFAVAPLSSRKQVYEVLAAFWPQLNTSDFPRAVMDAAAVGLYEDTELRLSG